MRRGDVVYADIPAVQGPAGHEQIGPRYAVVAQADASLANSSTSILIPTTSKLKAINQLYSFQVEPTKDNGFTIYSANHYPCRPIASH